MGCTMTTEQFYPLIIVALLTAAVALAVDTWLKYKDGIQ